ncbi:MAG: SEL1-like repeat protein [Gammaproteobacteria bacterium]
MKPSVLLVVLLAVVFAPQANAQGTHDNAPGTRPHNEALTAYEEGRYGDALRKYRESARWADKVSQFNLGVMHYLGQGTEPDLATAWAWFELSAERDYPEMVKAAKGAWAALDDDGRARALTILETLRPEFGDAVALERTAKYMDRERKGTMTGSRVGFVGNLRVRSRNMPEGMDVDGEDFYAAERWDFETIVELEGKVFDNLARGYVDVGELETLEDEAADEVEP